MSLPWRSLLQLAAGGFSWSALAVACGKQAAWCMALSLLEVGPWWPHAEVGPWGEPDIAGYSRMSFLSHGGNSRLVEQMENPIKSIYNGMINGVTP